MLLLKETVKFHIFNHESFKMVTYILKKTLRKKRENGRMGLVIWGYFPIGKTPFASQ